jgi:hypothetical protein
MEFNHPVEMVLLRLDKADSHRDTLTRERKRGARKALIVRGRFHD